MSVFSNQTGGLKVLLLWARARGREAAHQLREQLLVAAGDIGIEIRTILDAEDHDQFETKSQADIEAADCCLMLATEADWPLAQAAKREYYFYEQLVGVNGRRSDAFRFVKFGRHPLPKFHAWGGRHMSAQDPKALTVEERTRFRKFFQSEAEIKAGAPPKVPLTAEMIEKPDALLAATLWMINLDNSIWEIEEATNTFKIPKNALTGGLKYLKALHSIHAGLGNTLQVVMTQLSRRSPSPDELQPDRARTQLKDVLAPLLIGEHSRVEEHLHDCVGQGLIPALVAFRRRLESIPGAEADRIFLSACQERLDALLNHRHPELSDTAKQSASWWLHRYEVLIDYVDQPSFEFILDDSAAKLFAGKPSGNALALKETAKHARRLHVATLRLTFMVLAIFSFLQSHRNHPVEALEVEKMDMIILQLMQDWSKYRPTDHVVSSSNDLIRDHLAALEEYEEQGAGCDAAA
jgi:hypothetical protein